MWSNVITTCYDFLNVPQHLNSTRAFGFGAQTMKRKTVECGTGFEFDARDSLSSSRPVSYSSLSIICHPSIYLSLLFFFFLIFSNFKKNPIQRRPLPLLR